VHAKDEYSRRLGLRQKEVGREESRHRQIGNARLFVFIAAVAVAWGAWVRGAFSPWWLLIPAAIFIGLMILHDRVIRALRQAKRVVAHYEKAMARLDGRWAGHGEPGNRFADSHHPYAPDLDLFGTGSLFELLCAARTHAGEEVLAEWLCAGAPPQIVLTRQAAVAELGPNLNLREDLAVLGEEVRTGVHAEPLAAWGERPPLLDSTRLRLTAFALVVMVVAGAAVWAVWGIRFPFLLVVMIEGILGVALRARVQRIIQEVEQPAHDLALLAQVLMRVERERFASQRLVELRAALDAEDWPPSRRIARLNRLIELLDSRDAVPMRIIGPLLLWSTQLAFAIEAWRKKSGPAVRVWLRAVGEIEALCSLAAYSYEHAEDPFPEFVEHGRLFEAVQIAHPLLAEPVAVRNDVRLGDELRVLVVSGSNMSGKSTLLRTIGVNAVLAQAGAPVRAHSLRLTPLRVGACIRVADSLQEGTSRFYAEIVRLRQILELTSGPIPVLFLLDEFLHGTNSHDRRIGAEAIVRGLVARGAIGLVTTHDLALADIADALEPRGANVHFEDHLENGRMRFDYRMRPGIVRKSNALELMRSIGLEV
jgi:hypothetical protein